ncbi:MAG: hotdog domain-containing protein [Nocardioides sp.]|uniref:thioesterase family protein n=1 Tax=Nocardioides sp. TaxID=35761 RepID=UPI0039E4D500
MVDEGGGRLTAGLTASLVFEVTPSDTASAQGSGSLDVLATPRLLAFLEAATCAAVAPELEPGRTTVGVRVEVEHLAPSPVGARVVAQAVVEQVEGRRITFAVTATDAADGGELGRGRVVRAVVDPDRFPGR